MIFLNLGVTKQAIRQNGPSCCYKSMRTRLIPSGSQRHSICTMPLIVLGGTPQTAAWSTAMHRMGPSATATNISGFKRSHLRARGAYGARPTTCDTSRNTTTHGTGLGDTWLTTPTAPGTASSMHKATNSKPPSPQQAKWITTPWGRAGMCCASVTCSRKRGPHAIRYFG